MGFCEGAAEMTRMDNEKMERLKEQERLKAQKQIRGIFKAVDKDDSGRIDFREFEEILLDEHIMKYFKQMDMDDNEVSELFTLLDYDGTGEIDIDEFVEGLLQIKRGASVSDLAMLIFEHRRLVSEFRRFRDNV